MNYIPCQRRHRPVKLACSIVVLLVAVCLQSIAQPISAERDWYLSFINQKHITSKNYVIRIAKTDKGYLLTHPQQEHEHLPPTGVYRLTDDELVGENAVLTRIKHCLLYNVDNGYVEFRDLGSDSIMASYVALMKVYLDKKNTSSTTFQQNTRKAMNYAQKGLTIDPWCVECYHNLTIAMLHLGKPDSALHFYYKAAEAAPNYAALPELMTGINDSYIWFAWDTYGKKGRYKEAIDMYKKVLSLDSTYGPAWYQLGGAYYSNNQFEQALEAFKQAQTLNLDDTDAEKGINATLQMMKAKRK